MVAETLRSGRPVGRLPLLRNQQLDLAHHLGYFLESPGKGLDDKATPAASESARDGNEGNSYGHAEASLVLVTETDLMVNSVDTLGHLVGLEPVVVNVAGYQVSGSARIGVYGPQPEPTTT